MPLSRSSADRLTGWKESWCSAGAELESPRSADVSLTPPVFQRSSSTGSTGDRISVPLPQRNEPRGKAASWWSLLGSSAAISVRAT
ncbi:MAG: hypothetical protein RI958_3186 [Actinomycetota bacterium]